MRKILFLVLFAFTSPCYAVGGVCDQSSTIKQAIAACVGSFLPGVSGEIASYAIDEYYGCDQPLSNPPTGYGLIPGTQLFSVIANCVAMLPAVVLGAVIDNQYNSIQVGYGGTDPGVCPAGTVPMMTPLGISCPPDMTPATPYCSAVPDPKPNAIDINDPNSGYDCSRKAPNPTQVEVKMMVTCKDLQGNDTTKLSSRKIWCSADGGSH